MSRTVLVTDTGRGSAVAFLGSFARLGWRVIAADSDPRSLGFHSRACHERLVYPGPMESPQAFVECLLARVDAGGVDLVVPVTDACIHPLARARARFESRTVLAIAPDEALAITTDKRRSVALARELGLAVPETRFVGDADEARAAARELGFPLVVKDAYSRHYLPAEDRIEKGSVRFAGDAQGFERLLAQLAPVHDLLLQAYRPGIGVGIECIAREGRVLRAFQHRRLAEIPVTGGASAWRESTALDPELLRQTERLIAALRWTGLVMIEFKLGQRPWFIEVNGRVWGSLPLACRAGVDFPAEVARLYFPDELPAPTGPGPYRVGVRTYNLELMLSWIAQVLVRRPKCLDLAVPRRSRALAGLAGLLDPGQHSDLAGEGLGMRLAELGHIARKLVRKLGERA